MAREKRIVEREVRSVESNGRWKLGAAWFLSALILALSAGALTGVLASYYLNNSRYSVEVSALATYRPPQVTTIYADDGETVLAEFAIEKRIPIKEQDIPKNVEDALIAIEDNRFYDHAATREKSFSLQGSDVHTQGKRVGGRTSDRAPLHEAPDPGDVHELR